MKQRIHGLNALLKRQQTDREALQNLTIDYYFRLLHYDKIVDC